MEQQRFILFLTLSMLVFVAWINFGPKLFPGMFPQPVQRPAGAPAAGQQPPGREQRAVARQQPRADAGDDAPAVAPLPGAKPRVALGGPQAPRPPPPGQRRTLTLGSLDPLSGYFLSVELTSQGAAVRRIALNDPRYKDLNDRSQPLRLVGHREYPRRTFDLDEDRLDAVLARFDKSLVTLDWQVAETVRDTKLSGEPVLSGVTFRTVVDTPDGPLELRKRYHLRRGSDPGTLQLEVRDTDASGYLLEFELTVHNLGRKTQQCTYRLQGPVGVPLENIENTRIYRALKMGFHDPESGVVKPTSMLAADVVAAVEDQALQQWKKPIRYIGVDVQYFAVLLAPAENQFKHSYFDFAEPVLLEKAREKAHADVSVLLHSAPLHLTAGESVTERFVLFAGPKREALLADARLEASAVLEYGWFGAVAIGMLWLLKFLHGVGIPYGLAIICMTVLVRACLFPLSKKQALSAKKMKELQPKIQELRKKYGNDKEKMARAQMELFSKHNYNPFAGCLPIFLQLPIFIGLYTALNNAVDLRMAPFLWIDNLAAPDALFRLPFALPFLGRDFNLLPIVTVALFIVQQKMFTPPPADEQQALQFKMMNYMMVFFGFMFYHVPAGLCVYFIASSLWGMAERKLLDLGDSKPPAQPAEAPPQKPEERPAAGTAEAAGNGLSLGELRARRKERRRSRSER